MNSSPRHSPADTESGAYLLAINLKVRLELDIHSLPRRTAGMPVLAPGRYVYCGSAYGPGGPGARIARHLRRDKAPRWHVDRLTLAGKIVQTGILAGGSECNLCAGLRALPGVGVPLSGFGSSDYQACPAHLLAVPLDFDIAAYLSGFRSPA